MAATNFMGKVLHQQWGYNCTLNDFFLVVDETAKKLILVKLPKQRDSKDGQEGTEWPIIPDLDKEPAPKAGSFQATKAEESKNGLVCTYDGKSYYLWDGKPKDFTND